MANVVFDFDGTLADTFPSIIDVAYRLSPRTRRLPPEAIADLRRLPLLNAMRSLGIPLLRLPFLILFTRKRLTPHMGDVPAYPGVESTVKALHKAGHQLFILTSNYKENVEIFLQRHKLERYFVDIQTVQYANTMTKTLALRRLLKQYGLATKKTHHVGNEALDIRAARRVGMPSVAVAWGGYDGKALRASKPTVIIDQPQELVKLLQ